MAQQFRFFAALGLALIAGAVPEKLAAAGICAADSTSKIGSRATVSGQIKFIAANRKSLNLDDGKCELLVLVVTMPATCVVDKEASLTGTVVKAAADDFGDVNINATSISCR